MSEAQEEISLNNYRIRFKDDRFEDVQATGFDLENGRVSFRGHDDAEVAAFETASISYIADETVITTGPEGVSA